MTEEEKKKMLADFRHDAPKPEEPEEDIWTDEELIKAAKRIKERLGLDEELFTRGL